MKKIASPALRFLAWLIDFLLMTVLYQSLFLMALKNTEPMGLINQTVAAFIFLLLYIPIIVVLINLCLISAFGGTIGKILTGITIENSKGVYLTLKGAFVRNILGYWVSGLFLNLGFIWILIDKNRQGWHDMMTNTFVRIKSKTATIRGILFAFIFLLLNLYLLSNLVLQIKVNQNVFLQMYQDVKLDLRASPTPSPINKILPTPMPMPTVCIDIKTKRSMIISEARQLAQKSECTNEGQLKDTYSCNESTGTWWIEMEPIQAKCTPACVVNVNDRSVEINWRCTGLKNI